MSIARPPTRRTLLAAGCVLPALPALSALPAAAAVPQLKLFDGHIHFFTNDFAHYPIDTRAAREPEAVMRARVIADPGTPAKIFPLWERAGVTAGAGVQYSGAYKTDNSYVLDLADQFPTKIRPEIIVKALDPQSPDRLKHLATTRRVSALRLTGFGDNAEAFPWLDSPPALEVWSVAEKLGLPVGVTFLPPKATAASLAAIKALAIRFPRCTIMLEHFGWLAGTPSDTSLLPGHMDLRPHANVHFKWTTNNIDELATMGRSPSGFLRRAVDIFGTDRLMWGSDCGNTLRPYPGMVADAIASTAELTATERQRVLHDTGAALFNRYPTRGAGAA